MAVSGETLANCYGSLAIFRQYWVNIWPILTQYWEVPAVFLALLEDSIQALTKTPYNKVNSFCVTN